MKFHKLKTVEHIVLHCAATRASADIGAAEIDRMHRERSFMKIGYHFVIRRNGVIEKGREIDEVGAHVAGYNSTSIGICLVGGVAEDGKTPESNFTNAQWATLENLVGEMRQKYPTAAIVGHRDLDAHKACPSFDVKKWVASLS